MSQTNINTDECWLYAGSVLSTGYGRIRFTDAATGKVVCYRAHRVMYENMVGSIPLGLSLDHLCCVKSCVNPDHLEPVTNRVNIRRAMAKVIPGELCKNGHMITTKNMMFTGKTRLRCRQCNIDYLRAYRKRLR
jgi:hypothetical protein